MCLKEMARFPLSSALDFSRLTLLLMYPGFSLSQNKLTTDAIRMVKPPSTVRWKTHQLTTTIRTSVNPATYLMMMKFPKTMKVASMQAHRVSTMMRWTRRRPMWRQGESRRSQRKRSQSFPLLNSCSQQAARNPWQVLMEAKQLDLFADQVSSTKKIASREAENSEFRQLMNPR